MYIKQTNLLQYNDKTSIIILIIGEKPEIVFHFFY